MGELATEMWRLMARDVTSSNSDKLNQWAALRDRIAELESRVAAQAQIIHENEVGWLRDPDTGERVEWNGIGSSRRRGETPIVLGDDITSVGTLRQYLTAAEKRAEQAERIAAIAQSPEMLSRRAVLSYAPVGNEPLGHGKYFVCQQEDGELRVEVANQSERARVLSVVVFEADEAAVDALERRGTELIEAGEKLLAEYERQRKEAV